MRSIYIFEKKRKRRWCALWGSSVMEMTEDSGSFGREYCQMS